MYLDQASLLPGSACRGGGRGYHLWEQHNEYCHLPSHLLLCLVSASSQQCRSLGTHRLGASPPGLGDRRLKPLYELLHVDCQWRRLHQSRRSTLVSRHQRNHQWGSSLHFTKLLFVLHHHCGWFYWNISGIIQSPAYVWNTHKNDMSAIRVLTMVPVSLLYQCIVLHFGCEWNYCSLILQLLNPLQSSSRVGPSFPLVSVLARWLWHLHLFAASPFSSSHLPSSSWTAPWSCRR